MQSNLLPFPGFGNCCFFILLLITTCVCLVPALSIPAEARLVMTFQDYKDLLSDTSLSVNYLQDVGTIETKKAGLAEPWTKMGSDLLQLLGIMPLPDGKSIDDLKGQMNRAHKLVYLGSPAAMRSDGTTPNSDIVYVYIYVEGSPAVESIKNRLWEVISEDAGAGILVAWVETGKLYDLASIPEVRSIYTVEPPVTNSLPEKIGNPQTTVLPTDNAGGLNKAIPVDEPDRGYFSGQLVQVAPPEPSYPLVVNNVG